MKKILFSFCIFLSLVLCLHGQRAVRIYSGSGKINPYVTAKLEAMGAAMLLASPFFAMRGHQPPLQLAGQMVTVEVGVGKRAAIVGGLGGKYIHNQFASWPEPHDAKLMGLKFLLGYRRYLTIGLGQGLYIQPTAKFVMLRHKLVFRNDLVQNHDEDVIISSRVGWQMPIGKHLHFDVAVGPGIGIRAENYHSRYDWGYYWDTGVSEIDNPSLYLTGGSGYAGTTLYLVGDASAALGWRF